MHDAICRDLILPCIYTLTQFLEAVKLDEAQQLANFSERRKVSDGEASE